MRVVVYAQELPTFAARFWWLLCYYGFETVSVLDGGLAAWRAAGLPVTDEPTPVPTPASFSARPRPALLARRANVEAVAVTGTSSAQLVHALSTGEFHGDGLPEEARAGHIPGSVNIPWNSVIDAGSGRYLPAEQIKELLADTADGDDEVITYCGGGIAASMDAFALALGRIPSPRHRPWRPAGRRRSDGSGDPSRCRATHSPYQQIKVAQERRQTLPLKDIQSARTSPMPHQSAY